MEETYRFVHEFKPELFGAKLEEATAERNKAEELANDPKVPPLLGGDELKEARAEGGHLGGRPKTAQQTAKQMANDEDATPLSRPAENLHDDMRKVIPRQGTSSEYIVRRLKRDAANPAAPNNAEAKDSLAKLQSGTIVSARAAGIAAGIVKVPTPLDLLASPVLNNKNSTTSNAKTPLDSRRSSAARSPSTGLASRQAS